jgi:hypothetical protein
MLGVYDERIQTGDKAIIKWAGLPGEKITIVCMPRGAGDLLQVKYDDNDLIQAFSPLRSDYTLEKVKEN